MILLLKNCFSRPRIVFPRLRIIMIIFMVETERNRFSGLVTVFHDRPLPERGTPAGYAALIDRYALAVPFPRALSAISEHHRISEREGWRIFTPRHAPSADLEGHLIFALKYEGLDLAVLNRLFREVPAGAIAALVRAKPTGSYARRIWFLYEWLTGTRLDLPNAATGTYVPVLDPKQQWACLLYTSPSPRDRQKSRMP